jgi:hypothetical protein
MTAVMAIDFLSHILVISDCRISYKGGNPEPKDYLQKVYPFGLNGIIAFAGDIVSAKAIMTKIIKSTHLLNINEIPLLASEAYKNSPDYPGRIVELMFVASFPSEHIGISNNAIFPKNLLFEMTSPDFKLTQKKDNIRLGYAKKYDEKILLENRNNLINVGLDPTNRKFQIMTVVGSFGNSLAKLCENTVGGLFSGGVITPVGVDWLSYSIDDKFELKIEDGRFIQYDHEKERRIQLQTIFEFSSNQYSRKNLRLDTPKFEKTKHEAFNS